MNLEVKIQEDISLNNLIQLQDQGMSVMRSAHVGNARLYNQVLASVGVNMLLVDHNITGVDKNYRPESVICGGEAVRIAPDNLLTMKTQVADAAGTTTFLDEFHISGLREAIPEARVFTNTEYIRQNERIAGEIIRLCIEEAPELFTRVAESDGTTTKTREAARIARASGVLQLLDDPRIERGTLIPNEVDILCNFVIEAINSGNNTQFHVSGPDMIMYMKSKTIREMLGKLYSKLSSSSLSVKLPDNLEVQLVPGTELRFANTFEDKSRLENLVFTLEKIEEDEKRSNVQRKEFFTGSDKNNPDLRAVLQERISTRKKILVQTLSDSIPACSELFTADRTEIFISQYDTSRKGGLFVPELTKELTFRELKKIYKLIENLGNLP